MRNTLIMVKFNIPKTPWPKLSMATELKTYTGVAARILKFMSGGCTSSQAANAVGCDESYARQLLMEPDFKAQIAQHLQQSFESAIETDKNYEHVELEMSKRLKSLVPYVISLDDTLKTIKVLNGITKKTGNANSSNTDGINSTKPVTLMLPSVIINNFVINPNSEVVEIDGTELYTLNSNSIDALVIENELKQIEFDKTQPLPKLDINPKQVANAKRNQSPREDKWGNL